MKYHLRIKKWMHHNRKLVFTVTLISFGLICTPTAVMLNALSNDTEPLKTKNGELPLQSQALSPPATIDMVLEETIMRRMSVREFSDEPVSDEDLSTILWHAYGFTDEEKRAVHMFGNDDGVHIYVVKMDGVYSYDPVNHSLTLYKEGNYLKKVGWQYPAPRIVALVWNSSGNSNEYLSAAEIGEIGQNIYFAANAIGLGGVTTATLPPPMDRFVGLPEGEHGKIEFYLGHPAYEYDFTYRPMWFSLLPKIQKSSTSLTAAIVERKESGAWGETPLSQQLLVQLLWSSYGYSYLLDNTQDEYNVLNVTRHRTVPSACGMYPLCIYAVTETGTYRYYPNIVDTIYGFVNGWKSWPQITFLKKENTEDIRADIARSSESYLSTAPAIIISVLDVEQTKKGGRDLSAEYVRWLWYYESGAASHNVLLEATAWGLAGNIAMIQNKDTLCTLLNLSNEQFYPLLAIPVGIP